MAAEGLVGDDTGDLLESLKGAAHAVEGGVHAMEAKIEKVCVVGWRAVVS